MRIPRAHGPVQTVFTVNTTTRTLAVCNRSLCGGPCLTVQALLQWFEAFYNPLADPLFIGFKGDTAADFVFKTRCELWLGFQGTHLEDFLIPWASGSKGFVERDQRTLSTFP